MTYMNRVTTKFLEIPTTGHSQLQKLSCGGGGGEDHRCADFEPSTQLISTISEEAALIFYRSLDKAMSRSSWNLAI
eukprot:scaffold23143_cov92-Skeletonema_dohrnii-CCMP3373.AAC.2